jgi:hypothetical protein
MTKKRNRRSDPCVPAGNATATILDLDNYVVTVIMECLAGSSVKKGLGGRALVAGRDAFSLALTCRRLFQLFVDNFLSAIEYEEDFLPYDENPAHLASLVALAGKKLTALVVRPAPHEKLGFPLITIASCCPPLRKLHIRFPLDQCGESTPDRFEHVLEGVRASLRDLRIENASNACVHACGTVGISPQSFELVECIASTDVVLNTITSLGVFLTKLWICYRQDANGSRASSKCRTDDECQCAALPPVLHELCPNLEHLHMGFLPKSLCGGAVADEVERPTFRLERIPALEYLFFTDIALNVADMERWSAALPNLKSVSFGKCVFHKDHVPVSRRFHHESVWSLFVDTLVALTYLSYISLHSAADGGSRPAFKGYTRLTKLGLEQCCVAMAIEDTNCERILTDGLCAIGISLLELDLTNLNVPSCFERVLKSMAPCSNLEVLRLPPSFTSREQPFYGQLNRFGRRLRVFDIGNALGSAKQHYDIALLSPFAWADRNKDVLRDIGRNCCCLEILCSYKWYGEQSAECFYEDTPKVDLARTRRHVRGVVESTLFYLDELEDLLPKISIARVRSGFQNSVDQLY